MKKKAILKSIVIVLSIVILLFIFLLITGYKSIDNSGLEIDEIVDVSKVKYNNCDFYFFDNVKNNDENCFIFYQGGGVDEKAYANLLKKISLLGVDCFLISMPLDYVWFNINAADTIISNYHYDNYYIGGHSLGGVGACIYSSNNIEKIDGIILLASYSSKDLSNTDLNILSIYGSNDGVLNIDKYNEGKNYLPNNYIEYIIDGGNHAGFGCYGEQRGDNDSTISNDEQQTVTANFVYNFIINN